MRKMTFNEKQAAITRGELSMRDLNDAAKAFYSGTDPLTVFGFEDGTFTVQLCDNEYDFNSFEEVEEFFFSQAPIMNIIGNDSTNDFPVYCSNNYYRNHKAALLLNTETKEIDYHRADMHSSTEREWKDLDINLYIDSNFLSEKDLHDFVDDNADLLSDIANQAITYCRDEISPNLLDKLYEASRLWNEGRVIYDDFDEYRQMLASTVEDDMEACDASGNPEAYAQALYDYQEMNGIYFNCSLNVLKQDVLEYYNEYIKGE